MEIMEKKVFRQTEVGLIPEDWDIINLGDSLVFKNGLNKESEFFGYGTPIINYMDVFKYYGIYKKDIKGKVFLNNQEIKNFSAKKGDVFFTRTSETQEEIGISAVLMNDIKNCVFSGFVLRGRPKNNIISSEYYQYCLTPNYIRNQIISTSSYTTRALTNGRFLSKVKLFFPPTLEEQKAIANVLSDLDELISNLDQLINKKKAVKQSAMQHLLMPPNKGGKRLEGFTGEWNFRTVGELCKTFTKQTGFDYSNHIKPTLINKKQTAHLPFIQNKDFDGHKVNFDTDYYIPQDVALRFPMILLNERCLMISISGSIGKVGIFNNKEMAFIGGAVSVGKFNNPLYLDWVMNYLHSEAGQNMMLKDVKAGSHQNLILDDIRKMKIPMPKIEEQNAVCQILSDINENINELEIKKAKYQDIKQGMMQELLTGKTRLV